MTKEKIKTILSKFKSILIQDNVKKVNIFLHYTPDPDAMAAALGLIKFITHINSSIKCDVYYTGEISHSQNKTFVNVLNVPILPLPDLPSADLLKSLEFDLNVVVDSTPEKSLPEKLKCTFCIDHHKDKSPKSDLVDIRDVGATCSIIWEYLQHEGISFDKNSDTDCNIATAMLIGIKTDTQDLVSDTVKNLDFEAYMDLLKYVNRRHLSAIINYSIPNYLFELRSRLDKEVNFRKGTSTFAGGLGFIPRTKRDSLPVLADERARVEGTDTAFVFAIVDDCVEVSVRSVGTAVDVHMLCQQIFGKEYAGGKSGAGAAKIPMNFFNITSCPEEIKAEMCIAINNFIFNQIFNHIE